MRLLMIFTAFGFPAHAWEFTPGLPCLLDHSTPDAQVELTYDPTVPVYSITVTRSELWPEGAIFEMRFDGPAGLSISTDRHVLSRDGKSLTVLDRGFGNVLNGLQFNETATALLGDTEVVFSLDGAADPVAQFRDCPAVAGA